MYLKPAKVLRPHNAFSQIISQSLLFRETLKLQCGDSCLQKQTGAKRNQQPSLVKGMADFQKTHTHTFIHTVFTTRRDSGGCWAMSNQKPSDVSSDLIPLIRLLDCEPRWGLKSDLLGCDDFAVQFAKGQGSRYLVVKNGTEMSSVPMDHFW